MMHYTQDMTGNGTSSHTCMVLFDCGNWNPVAFIVDLRFISLFYQLWFPVFSVFFLFLWLNEFLCSVQDWPLSQNSLFQVWQFKNSTRVCSPSQRTLWGWKQNTRKPSLKKKTFCFVRIMGRYLCSSRHHGFVIMAAFCPDTSDLKKCLLWPPSIFVCFYSK